ncbi:MAG: response regulator transcription factor [Oscillospiraceae bacterium]
MNIAICDDKIECIRDLSDHIDFYFTDKRLQYNEYDFTSGEEFLKSDIIFDIVFLDIELGDINGLEVGKVLKRKSKHTVFIVVTAYSHYLDDAMNLQVLRFLDKPVEALRLYSGIDKAIELINANTIDLYLKGNDKCQKICYDDIIFLEAELRKTKIVTTNGEFHTPESLSSWENKLSPSFFASPHNSFIVNMDKIVEYTRNYMVLDGGKKYTISIAPKRQCEFKKRLARFMESRR